MGKMLIRNVLCAGRKTNILIEGNRFSSLDAPEKVPFAKVIEADGLAILPPFFNTHTHAAMSLLRGYADDMELHKWLTEYIWPYEAKMTSDDIEKGSYLAVREMIATGSVFFNDMYFDIDRTVKAVDELGIRAALGVTFMESHTKAQQSEKIDIIKHWNDPTGGRITITVAPHAIYTVGSELLKKTAELARENGLKYHIHLSETESEVADCIRLHGCRPVEYLENLGVLGPNVIAAHVIHVNEKEADILAGRGVTISHCPCSNMKLASGIFPYKMLSKAGCRITIGTDGDSSNNNLDMREEMKFAALLAKVSSGDPQAAPAEEILRCATAAGAEAFGIDSGRIEEGALADALLVDLGDIKMQPCHNLVSNWVYAADSRAIKTVICDGRIVG